ncbi:MAG: DUF3137 domain-containing protein [Verrucomicrobiales bacterium]|nr:DUF3137 domain-containing protein [Verrucomicrobiales bacterium]
MDQVLDEIYPTLQRLELDRAKYVNQKSNCIWGVIVPIMVCAAIGALLLFPVGVIFLVLGGIGSMISYHYMAGKHGKAYVAAYKETVIGKLAELIDPNLKYDQHRGIDEGLFIRSELFSSPDRYHTEDLIHGEYGKTSLMLGELHAEDRRTTRDSDGKTKTEYVTIFKGLMLIADFHKHFEGRTFVLPDVAEKAFGGFGRALQKMGGPRGTSLIQMEDAEFEKAFAVYSSDQVEARYILSPAMMRRLLEMRNRFGKDVRLSFRESSVWIAVPHRNPYLEPNTNVEATDRNQLEKMLGEISLFLQVIEELDLNTRIWTKE